jgi:hypothetical protein
MPKFSKLKETFTTGTDGIVAVVDVVVPLMMSCRDDVV